MGSSSYGIFIQTEGHEKLFYKAIKNYILSLSPAITCAEDPEEEFNVSTKGADHIATLNFSINGTHIFKLYRPAVLEQDGSEVGVTSINFAMDAVAGIPENSGSINFRPDQTSTAKVQSDTGIRGIWISQITNSNFALFHFGAYNESLRYDSSVNRGFVYCYSNNRVYLALKTPILEINKPKTFNISELEFYDGTTPGLIGSFLSRFTYATPPGSIDYIKSTIYMSNNEKVFENRAIYDSTTVTVGDTVSLKDGAYVAVGTHQLVKVS